MLTEEQIKNDAQGLQDALRVIAAKVHNTDNPRALERKVQLLNPYNLREFTIACHTAERILNHYASVPEFWAAFLRRDTSNLARLARFTYFYVKGTALPFRARPQVDLMSFITASWTTMTLHNSADVFGNFLVVDSFYVSAAAWLAKALDDQTTHKNSKQEDRDVSRRLLGIFTDTLRYWARQGQALHDAEPRARILPRSFYTRGSERYATEASDFQHVLVSAWRLCNKNDYKDIIIHFLRAVAIIVAHYSQPDIFIFTAKSAHQAEEKLPPALLILLRWADQLSSNKDNKELLERLAEIIKTALESVPPTNLIELLEINFDPAKTPKSAGIRVLERLGRTKNGFATLPTIVHDRLAADGRYAHLARALEPSKGQQSKASTEIGIELQTFGGGGGGGN